MTDFRRELEALDELEDLLDAYADARLTPDGPVLSRIRANVLREMAASAAGRAAAERMAMLEAHRPRRLGDVRLPRRAVALGLAASLTLGSVAAVLAAPPGSPLYDARLSIESLSLPAQEDRRLSAHEAHLADRLAEAEAAAARGDLVGLSAALAAYQAEVDVSVGDVGSDPNLLALLQEVLARHLAVLQALQAQLPSQAQAAIDRALHANESAATKVQEKAHGAGRPGQTPNAGPGSQPSR